MIFRRFAGIAAVVLLTASAGFAFKYVLHVEITEEALKAVYDRMPASFRQMYEVGFSTKAIDEIGTANKAMDTANCGEDNEPAKPCQFSLVVPSLGTFGPSEAIAAFHYADKLPNGDHFDAEAFQDGSDRIYQRRELIITSLQNKNFIVARKLLGFALHSLQDFYAHSNWVEIGLGRLESRLGTKDGFKTPGAPRIAFDTEPTCLYGRYLFNDLKPEVKNQLLLRFRLARDRATDQQIKDADIDDTVEKIYQDLTIKLTNYVTYDVMLKAFADTPLTSGVFYYSWDPTRQYEFMEDPAPITGYFKCRHGYTDPFNVVYEQFGINKDEDSRPGYANARVYAKAHSEDFIYRLLNDPAVQKEPWIVPAFMGHPAIYSLSPQNIRRGENGVSLQISGTGFDLPDTAVLWNGKPITTRRVDSGALVVDVPAANLSRAGAVEIRVSMRDAYSGGKSLLSNPAKFTIDEVQDCPGAVRPHRHNTAYIDVNANRWNDAGIVVVQGQSLTVEVLRGSVVWRAGGLLSGATGEAPPQGDPSATPATVLLWVDPPIPINRVPVGALIGMVVPTALLDDRLQPTIPLTEKPDGVKFFPIGPGGVISPMPESGRVYFGINDGAFFNNGGCFQARVVK
jgi:hypothetical protein